MFDEAHPLHAPPETSGAAPGGTTAVSSSDASASPPSAAEPTPARNASPSDAGGDYQIINGGIDIVVVFIDGSVERVKVLQLPISRIGEWGRCQGDEAYLVELLCDKLDRSTDYNLANARLAEMRVQTILFQAPFAQIEEIEKRLADIRTEIAALEAKVRWSDTITHESAAEIRELGMSLNKKKFVAQTNRKTADSQAILDMMPPEKSPLPSSSSPSPASAESPIAT